MRTGVRWTWRTASIVLGVGFASTLQAQQITLLTENFDSLAASLRPPVNECYSFKPADQHPSLCGYLGVWTDELAGWTIDDTGVPGWDQGPDNDGATEWAGWSFAKYSWWVDVAGDQNRSQFTKASGNVAIADPDEWDDRTHPSTQSAYFNALMTSPAMNISAVPQGALSLTFDSSWRPEGFDDGDQTNNQTAVITAIYQPGGEEIEVLRWDSDESGHHYKPDATNETVTIPLQNPAGATSVQIKFGLLLARNDWWWAIDNLFVKNGTTTVASQNFDSAVLEAAVDEPGPSTNTWTPTPPTGWVVDRSTVPGVGDPNVGVEEFEGWNFMVPGWWSYTAGNQNRVQFTKGKGIIAVADPDEWDDWGNPEALGTFNSSMTLPAVNLRGMGPNTVVLKFDSSWRDEDTQTAVITVSYDAGAAVEVLRWESQAGPYFHNDNTNESVLLPLNNPLGAESAVVTFSLINATDDWWWAIDNVEIVGELSSDTIKLLAEDFNGLPFGPCVEENCAGGPANVWSKMPPLNWTVDRSGVPGVGNPNEGMEDWEGWTFANKDWWAWVAEGQQRELFTKGVGTVAIADPDEWDDKGNPDGIGTFNSFLITPAITITGAAENTVSLTFDSSWRDEDNQTASITASFDGGPDLPVLTWTSTAGPDFHDDSPDETVTIPLNNPAGATTVVLKFGLTQAINNWWWAIDNLVVTDGTTTFLSENFESVTLGPPAQEPAYPPANIWTNTPPAGWTLDNTGVPGFDLGLPDTQDDGDGTAEWNGWSFPQYTWWRDVAGDQDRSLFTKASGGIAVADPDEWDDKPHPPGSFNAFMSTPEVNIQGVQPGNLYIAFDSSWQSYDPPWNLGRMTAVLRVSYDGSDTVQVLRWANYPGVDGDPGDPDYKPDAENESVLVPLKNPSAGTARIEFGLVDAGNDWWWAVDNVTVFALKNTQPFDLDDDTDVDMDDFAILQRCYGEPLTPSSLPACLQADYDKNNVVDSGDVLRFANCGSGPNVPQTDESCGELAN